MATHLLKRLMPYFPQLSTLSTQFRRFFSPKIEDPVQQKRRPLALDEKFDSCIVHVLVRPQKHTLHSTLFVPLHTTIVPCDEQATQCFHSLMDPQRSYITYYSIHCEDEECWCRQPSQKDVQLLDEGSKLPKGMNPEGQFCHNPCILPNGYSLSPFQQKPTPILTHVQTCTDANCIACNRSENSTIFISVSK